MLAVNRGNTHGNNHGKARGKARGKTRGKSRGKAQREQGARWASGRSHGRLIIFLHLEGGSRVSNGVGLGAEPKQKMRTESKVGVLQ